MNLIPVILDNCPSPATASPGSVLDLPLGRGSVLDALAGELRPVGASSIWLLTAHRWGNGREGRPGDSSLPAGLRVVDFDGVQDLVDACEASDYLLVAEPNRWPAAGYDVASLTQACENHPGVTYAIAIGSEPDSPWERIECDTAGHIRRVQRVYDGTAWPVSAADSVFCIVTPARAVCDLRFGSLQELREHLQATGILARDLPVATDLWDAGHVGDLLTLNKRLVAAAVAGRDRHRYQTQAPGVLAGPGCRIDPSARLIGPVVLQGGNVVEDEATVVGPVVVGPEATIGSRAVLTDAIIDRAAAVPADANICGRLIAGNGEESSEIVTGQQPRESTAAYSGVDQQGEKPASGRGRSRSARRRRRVHLAAKRMLDVMLSLLGLILVSPVLILAAVLVKTTSKGPLFFIHQREGKGGKEFSCIKFRTMVPDAHLKQRELYSQNQVDGPQFKIDNDPRVTPIGAWLRRTNIDELPQLFNVLAGHMSLVGPRPSPFRENQICVPWRLARLSVRPGITGMWQICRDRRNDGDFHQWIHYDLAYVRHFSLWLDIKILYHTIASRAGRRRVPLSKLISGPDTGAEGGRPSVLAKGT